PAKKSHSKKRTARIPEPTMHRIAEEDLRYKSYTLNIRQMLFKAARTSRVTRCNLLLYSLKNEASERIRFFSDEKKL
ncbi:hypothetical protein ALC53_08273, partial [Atta colombica]